jgi:hypothetical protein
MRSASLRADMFGIRWNDRWQLAARAVWLTLAALAIGLFVTGVWVSYPEYQHVCNGGTCPEFQLDPAAARAWHDLGFSLDFYAAYNLALDASFALVYGAIAALIFWRKPADRLALFVSIALLTFGTVVFPPTLEALATIHPTWQLPVTVLGLLGSVAFGLFLLLFPDGRFVPRWTRWVVLLWIAWRVLRLWLLDQEFAWDAWSSWLDIVVWVGWVGTVVYSQVDRYRHVSTAVQRQQTKWVILGISVALIGSFGVTLALAIFAPEANSANAMLALVVGFTLIDLFLLLIAVSLGIAILRHHLFDIDVLINRAVVYGTLTVGLAAVFEIGVLLLQGLFQPLTGDSSAAIVGSTLLVAALARPGRDAIQHAVDRRFYRRKYDAVRTVDTFSARMREEIDLDALVIELQAVVQETMQPAHVSFWLRQRAGPGGTDKSARP